MNTNEDYIERVSIMQHDGKVQQPTIAALASFPDNTVLYRQDYPKDTAVLSGKKWCEIHSLTNKHVRIVDTGDRIEVRSRHSKSLHDSSK